MRPAGGSWPAAQTVASPGGEDPRVASDASGGMIIVANRQAPEHSTGIQAVLRVSGEPFSPAQTISAPDNDFHPRIAMNARGDALVAWERDAGGCSVEAMFRPADGGWGKPRVLSDTHAGCPADQHVAIDGRGDGVVVWSAQRGRRQFVESASLSANGRWTAHRLAEAPLIGETVDAGMDEGGDIIVVWGQPALRGRGSTIWTRTRPADQGWGPARTIPGADGWPSLAIDARGDALVAWQGKREVEVAARPAGRSWRTPYAVSAHERPGPRAGGDGLAALDVRGDALVTWQNPEGIRTAWHASLFP